MGAKQGVTGQLHELQSQRFRHPPSSLRLERARAWVVVDVISVLTTSGVEASREPFGGMLHAAGHYFGTEA